MTADTEARIRARLAGLAPIRLAIENESAQHAGHAGAAGGGGHFRLDIVSEQFTGLARVKRHRLIYDALGDLMRGEVHALAITARSPADDAQ